MTTPDEHSDDPIRAGSPEDQQTANAHIIEGLRSLEGQPPAHVISHEQLMDWLRESEAGRTVRPGRRS